MKCARLHLQQRACKRLPRAAPSAASPAARRYCQRRLIDPNFDEDPRWSFPDQQRFCSNLDFREIDISDASAEGHRETLRDLFLTVQTLKFQGDTQEQRRPRACFKYKAPLKGQHRMFVKQPVQEADDDDCSSQHTAYYFDDYVKYILNPDRSRPSSEKSAPYTRAKSDSMKISQAIQVDSRNEEDQNQSKQTTKSKKSAKATPKEDKTSREETKNEAVDNIIQDAKVAYHKSGKRKSITISRTQSPETVQVIRVDVVCNYSSSNSVISEEVSKKDSENTIKTEVDSKTALRDLKNSRFANRYFLTKSIKALDESVSAGAKVTLLCKTFKLSDRSKARNREANINK